MPESVISSFSYTVVGCVGACLVMNIVNKNGLLKNLLDVLPYLATGIALWYINYVVLENYNWYMLIGVGGCILVGYIRYRIDLKKAESADNQPK